MTIAWIIEYTGKRESPSVSLGHVTNQSVFHDPYLVSKVILLPEAVSSGHCLYSLQVTGPQSGGWAEQRAVTPAPARAWALTCNVTFPTNVPACARRGGAGRGTSPCTNTDTYLDDPQFSCKQENSGSVTCYICSMEAWRRQVKKLRWQNIRLLSVTRRKLWTQTNITYSQHSVFFNFEIELRTRLTVQNWDIDTCELGPSHVLNAVHNDNCSPRLGSSSFVPTTFLRQKFYVTNERDGASMVFCRYIRHVCVPAII